MFILRRSPVGDGFCIYYCQMTSIRIINTQFIIALVFEGYKTYAELISAIHHLNGKLISYLKTSLKSTDCMPKIHSATSNYFVEIKILVWKGPSPLFNKKCLRVDIKQT